MVLSYGSLRRTIFEFEKLEFGDESENMSGYDYESGAQMGPILKKSKRVKILRYCPLKTEKSYCFFSERRFRTD
jgi:hypothetical protein